MKGRKHNISDFDTSLEKLIGEDIGVVIPAHGISPFLLRILEVTSDLSHNYNYWYYN